MKRIESILGIMLAPVLAWLFPVVFLYTRNAKEVSVSEVFNPAGAFLLVAVIFVLAGKLLFNEWETASFFSAILGVFLANFELGLDYVQKYAPEVRYWHLLYIVAIIVFALTYLLKRWSFIADALLISKIVFGGLIVLNLVMALPTIIQRISDIQKVGEQTVQSVQQQEKSRNIYYILCDEYASFEQLEEEFGFDNVEFKNELQNLGFNISESSRNESYQTVVVMANVMQLDYLATDSSTSVELENLTLGGNLQRILIENGYTLRGVGKTDWLGFEGTVENTGGATTADGASMTSVILERSFLKPFVARNYVAEAQEKIGVLESLKNIEIVPDASVFTMCYIDVPHHPYYFDENGYMNPSSKWSNDDGKNNDAYIGMVKFTNSYVLPLVKRIVEEDPNAIVILASDHGNRFGNVAETSKYKILNNLYYAGLQIPDFEGLSSVNTMRMILNREFDMNMEYIALP